MILLAALLLGCAASEKYDPKQMMVEQVGVDTERTDSTVRFTTKFKVMTPDKRPQVAVLAFTGDLKALACEKNTQPEDCVRYGYVVVRNGTGSMTTTDFYGKYSDPDVDLKTVGPPK
jgi:hypothetical protein